MDASIDHHSPFKSASLGRFTRVSVQTRAGEIEARLSEAGNWELRVRNDEDTDWRLACTGDLDCGAVTARPVVSAAEETMRRGQLTVEPSARRVTVDGAEVALARKEFSLLLALAARPDRVFTKEELLATVWGHNVLSTTRTLDSHASRLRNKLRRAGAKDLIVNCRCVGYRLWDRADLTISPPPSPDGRLPNASGLS